MSGRSLVSVPFESPFSLEQTLKSGQLFHWQALTIDGIAGYAGCIGSREPSWIAQPTSDEVVTLAGDQEIVSEYFGLNQSLADIHASFPTNDPVLAEAIAYCPGIRVARQPVWECLATFITSSLKQVAHIRGISLTVRERYGDPYELNDSVFYSYPEPERIVEVGEQALRECSLGYRAKSLALSAAAIAAGEIDLKRVEESSDRQLAQEELLQLHGVGEKIANCVLLFSCGQWGAFPIDVWIERILRSHYRKRLKGARLQQWAVDYFGPNAGYAQQYLFHFARKTL